MRTDTAQPSDRDLLSRAVKVVNNASIGVMTTVDEHGQPHARWMTSVARDGIKSLITLTALSTRKVAQLEADPRVCWMFTAPDYDDVVTLYGSVSIERDPITGMQAWDRLARAAQTYAFGSLRGEDPQLATLITQVRRVEIISPHLEIYAPRDLGSP